MDDDDEFGDLYTDVLCSFPSSSTVRSQPAEASSVIDLNVESHDTDVFILNSISHKEEVEKKLIADDVRNSTLMEYSSNPISDSAQVRVSQAADEEDLVLNDAFVREDLGSEHVIPGLDTLASTTAPAAAAADDWDSDSEDDLQIVLNEEHHAPPVSVEPNGMMIGSDGDDEDGEPLVIVADGDAAGGLQNTEEQDWGDEAGQLSEGKENNDPGAKPNAGVQTGAKTGYTNYGYHPFHSQFKYIRPGAAPPPGSGGGPNQARPPANIISMSGRGRGDWRPPGIKGPPMQKGFHPGPWGNNVPGRGLEFTLPSHKNIFDVDIDSFEEKPWKYPGIDESDFFNFGLNEESWKEYCKQLEQLRLESTMQSKIRVYESGRTEQEYDPDMPPELAAAAGIHDSAAEIVDIAKVDSGQGDLAKGSACVRPPLPTGRAIQVETGCGERLPSVDTRPPRIRDSDAVIEIVLQDCVGDESTGNDISEHPDDGSAREDDQVDVVDEHDTQCGDDDCDGYTRGYDVMDDGSGKKSPMMNSRADIKEEEGDRSSPRRVSSDHHPGSTDHASSENVGSLNEERWTEEKASQRSPHMSSGESALDRRSLDYEREDSMESMEGKHSPESSFATPMEEVREGSLERKDADIESGKSKVDTNVVASSNASKEKYSIHLMEQQKLSPQVEPPANDKEDDEGGGFKASRSSDNSKATGSSRDHQKWRESVDEEVVQNGRSTSLGDVKRNHGEGGHDFRRKDREGRTEMERNYTLGKGREEYYSNRDWDPHAVNQFHVKSESSDRRKERDYAESGWQRRDEDPHGRRIRAEDVRKQERADEMVSRHRGKVREVDRSDKEEYLHSRKILDNGIWRGYHDKDVGLRYREKDDVSKSRHETFEDLHSKRRKDDEHARREHVEKDDILLSHRDSSSSHRKRERGILSLRKREDQPRIRDSMDDHHSVRLKDEVWMQRERAELQRERDEWYRAKLSYEENFPRREREDGRASIRSSRNVEDKIRAGHSRGGDEYKGHDKSVGRHSEQLKRRERVEEESNFQHRGGEDVYARGNPISYEGKRLRQERSSGRNSHAVDASESHRLHDKKHKETVKKARESEGQSTLGQSKRHQGDKSIANEVDNVKGRSEQTIVEHDTSLHNLTREGGEEVSSDDEQYDSKRGRSKLERWTSHKDRDYNVYSKSSSMKIKEISKNKNTGCESSFGGHDETAKKVEAGDSLSLVGVIEGGGSEGKDGDERPMDGRHLDTVEKLKRRSERFKVPLASEKDPLAIKKMESEPLPSTQNDTPANAEVKNERPPRKRRWISS